MPSSTHFTILVIGASPSSCAISDRTGDASPSATGACSLYQTYPGRSMTPAGAARTRASSGTMSRWKCVKLWRSDGHSSSAPARQPSRRSSHSSALSPPASSGKLHSPPHTPAGARCSSSTAPSPLTAISMRVRRTGSALRGRGAGSSCCRPSARARQSLRERTALRRPAARACTPSRRDPSSPACSARRRRRGVCASASVHSSRSTPASPAPALDAVKAREHALRRCRRVSDGAARTRARGSRPRSSGRCRAAPAAPRSPPAARRRAPRRCAARRRAGCGRARSSRDPTTDAAPRRAARRRARATSGKRATKRS